MRSLRLRTSPADLQVATDAAAWRVLLRRRPELAARIRTALASGWDVEQVVASAHPRASDLAALPRLPLLLPCAVHGCALDLERERAARAPRRRLSLLRLARRRSA
jgi:hypothetical protein